MTSDKKKRYLEGVHAEVEAAGRANRNQYQPNDEHPLVAEVEQSAAEEYERRDRLTHAACDAAAAASRAEVAQLRETVVSLRERVDIWRRIAIGLGAEERPGGIITIPSTEDSLPPMPSTLTRVEHLGYLLQSAGMSPDAIQKVIDSKATTPDTRARVLPEPRRWWWPW